MKSERRKNMFKEPFFAKSENLDKIFTEKN
jgi:hypothetical protein